MSSRAGERLGPYVVEGELGRGGMGVVLRARDAAGRAVAIKRLVVRDEELARRLLRESDVRIEHENVVRVLGAGLDETGEPYVVTELLEGETLASALLRGLELPVIVELFAEAADGLAAIHAHGIVHRDVKPSNLFVTKAGTLKVLDFGISTASEGASVLTATGALVGTPAYTSPEQARGERSVDARADVWSLGMSLYEALTGSLPFRRDGALATALAVERDPLPRLGTRAPEVPFELALLVERCLSRDPADRPESATELARLLRAVPASLVGRPSQPLFHATDVRWRNVVLVLLRGELPLGPVPKEAGVRTLSVGSDATAIVLGAGSARGDELDRALELARTLVADGRIVVATGRVREPDGALDEEPLAAARVLFGGEGPGIFLTAEAAEMRPPGVSLAMLADGSAELLRRAPPPLETCVGRDAELAVLEDRVRAALERKTPATLCVTGEPGLGKSTVLATLAARVAATVPGAVAIEVAARRHRGGPLAALLAALDVDPRGELGIQQAVDVRRIAILDHVGERLVDAAGVVLLVDDLDHADPATRALTLELGTFFEGRPLAVVATARTFSASTSSIVVTASAASRGAIERRALEPMSAAALRTMLEGKLGAPLDPRVLADVTQRAGGNPLFAEHLARSAVARPDATELPATIETAVQAQLDALFPELAGAARSLSVAGTEGTAVTARAALGARAGALTTRLEEAGVLAPTTSTGAWQFKHRIVAEVAYAGIDPEVARRLHRELAQRLEVVGSVSPEEILTHADRGGDLELGARFAREAFFLAAKIGDGPRVLSLLDRVREPPEDSFPCLLLAAEAAAFVHGSEAAERWLEEALVHARTDDERARARIELAEHQRRRGDSERARLGLDEALREATEPETRARAACRSALAEVAAGRAEDAGRLLELPLAGLSPAVEALVWDTRGYVAGALGALGPRRVAYDRAGTLYTEAGDVRRAAGANANLADTLRAMGSLGPAERTLRRAIDGARRVGNGLTEAYALTNLAAVLALLDRRREALATLEVAAARASSVGDQRLQRVVALYRGVAERRDAEPHELAATDDPTLHATALVLRLEHGAPSEAELDAAEALLRGEAGLEESVLEIGRALHRHRPTERTRALVVDRLDHALRSIGDPAWSAQFALHVEHVLGPIAAEWVADHRGSDPARRG